MNNARYLRITMHDNDFITSLKHVGYLLRQIFEFQGVYPAEEDIPVLSEMVNHLWYATHNIMEKVNWYRNYKESKFDYFDCRLEFVNYLDIPDWDNSESIYIPMFIGEILTR